MIKAERPWKHIDQFGKIRAEISDWLNEHPYTITVTSGAPEAIPVVDATLSKAFERSAQSEDDKNKIVQLLRILQNASDEQLTALSNKHNICTLFTIQVIVHGNLYILLGAQISLRGLD
jgi:hypothetical protein